jgi:hypothetical protein
MHNVCEGEKAFLHGCRHLYVVFASELQGPEAHSIAWISIMSDIDVFANTNCMKLTELRLTFGAT